MNLKTNIMEDNFAIVDKLMMELYEEMRQLNIKSERPKLDIAITKSKYCKKFNVDSNTFDYAYKMLIAPGIIKEIERNKNIITFKVLK